MTDDVMRTIGIMVAVYYCRPTTFLAGDVVRVYNNLYDPRSDTHLPVTREHVTEILHVLEDDGIVAVVDINPTWWRFM